MNSQELTSKMGLMFGRAALRLRKHSPEILVVAGIVGTVASAVIACRATMKATAVTEEAKENKEKIEAAAQEGKLADGTEYTDEDYKKDLTIFYVQTGVKYAKLYAPALALGLVSITAILASNNILHKRNVALAAAYATVDKTFKEYRARVVERFGKEVDKELKYNIKALTVEETTKDPETGKTKKNKKQVNVVGIDGYSDYARFFDSGCTGWEKNPEYNLMFLKAEQNHANDLLKARGYLFLNEVYDRLGIPVTKAGQAVGWVYDPENPVGDNYVDFGIYNSNRETNRDFVNGYEPTILLDFNVDGNILDLI